MDRKKRINIVELCHLKILQKLKQELLINQQYCMIYHIYITYYHITDVLKDNSDEIYKLEISWN